MGETLAFHKSPELCSNLSQQVVQLREAKELLDFTLCTDGKTIPCHRLVLAANSPMLRTMLSADMKEASTQSVDLKIPYKVLVNIVDYMYSGVCKIPAELLHETLKASHYLALNELTNQCTEAAYEQIKVANVISWTQTAIRLELEELVQVCQEFLFANIQQVILQDDFHVLDVSELSNLLLCCDASGVSGDDMLRAVLEWVSADTEERTSCCQQLMECIDLQSCSHEVLKDIMLDHKTLIESDLTLCKTVTGILMTSNASTSYHVKQRKSLNDKQLCRVIRPKDIRNSVFILGGILDFKTDNKQMFLLTNKRLLKYAQLANNILTYCSVCQIPNGLMATGGYKQRNASYFITSLKIWKETTSLPKQRLDHQSAFVDGLVYVLGGYMIQNDYPYSACCVQYLNLQTKRWFDGPAMPGKKQKVTAMGGKLYMITDDGQLYSHVPKSNGWVFLDKCDFHVRGICSSKHSKLFAIGWENFATYSMDTQQWCKATTITGMPSTPSITYDVMGEHRMMMAANEQKVILVDGNKIREYDIQKKIWTEVKDVVLPDHLSGGFVFFTDAEEHREIEDDE